MTNVLLITADQLNARVLGAYGDPLGATPNLDAFSRSGTRLTGCRTPNPFCQPARASILTGQYPSSHGVIRNGIDLPDEAVHESVASAFSAAGHATALIGKAHFASFFPDFPTGRVESIPDGGLVPADWHGPYFGFDHVELVSDVHNIRLAPNVGQWNWGFGPPPFGLHYARHLFRDGHARGVERLRLLQPEADGRTWDVTQTWRNHLPEEEHHTTWIADRSIEWLRGVAATGAPFFGWISFADPHHPFDPPMPWCDRYGPADVAEVLPAAHPEEFDAKPGLHRMYTTGFRGSEFEWANPGWTLFSTEQQLGILAAYYGMVAQIDHQVGRVLAELDRLGVADDTLVVFTADHGDYLGEHSMMLKGPLHYESLVRVPCLMRGPGVTGSPGSVDPHPMGTLDLPTLFLDACGIARPSHLEGTHPFTEAREWALTEDDIVPGSMEYRTLSTARYRVTEDRHNPSGGELYDLDDDPGELVNRWADPALAGDRTDLLALLHDVMRPDVGKALPQVCTAG